MIINRKYWAPHGKRRVLTGKNALLFQLSDRLSYLIVAKYGSDKAFLVKSKYNETQFYRFKQPTNNPTFLSLYKISKASKISLKELFTFDFEDEIEVPDTRWLSNYIDKKKQ